MSPPLALHPAVECVPRRSPIPLVLTCEHASAHFPPEYSPSAADTRWQGTHWAVDLGARALTLRVAALTGAPAVLSTASRLICDVNRTPDAPDLAVAQIEGEPLPMNARVDIPERQRRLARFHTPFHRSVDAVIAQGVPGGARPLLLSVHSFTPVWRGQPRPTQVGVLFDRHERLATRWAASLSQAYDPVHLNRPYSGLEGLIYSVSRHGGAHNLPYVELEFRQDLLADPQGIARAAQAIIHATSA